MAQKTLLKVVFFDIGKTLVDNKQWIPGAKEIIADLRGMKIRLGLITNTDKLKRADVLKLLPADFDLKLFEDNLILMSSEVNIKKPDSQIFELAIKRAGVNANECLFCTEELPHTLVAQQGGMRVATLQKPPASDIKDLLKNLIEAGLLPK